MGALNTCKTCGRRSAEPVQENARGDALYDCDALNRSPRVHQWGEGTPWLAVRLDFGCVLWTQRKT